MNVAFMVRYLTRRPKGKKKRVEKGCKRHNQLMQVFISWSKNDSKKVAELAT